MVKGFTQTERIDFNEVFSLVVKHNSIRVLFAMITLHDLELEYSDVKNTFFHGELEEQIDMIQPKGFFILGIEDHDFLLKNICIV